MSITWGEKFESGEPVEVLMKKYGYGSTKSVYRAANDAGYKRKVRSNAITVADCRMCDRERPLFDGLCSTCKRRCANNTNRVHVVVDMRPHGEIAGYVTCNVYTQDGERVVNVRGPKGLHTGIPIDKVYPVGTKS